jgi:hypothetical protein
VEEVVKGGDHSGEVGGAEGSASLLLHAFLSCFILVSESGEEVFFCCFVAYQSGVADGKVRSVRSVMCERELVIFSELEVRIL